MGVKQTQTEVTKRHANEIPMQDKKKGPAVTGTELPYPLNTQFGTHQSSSSKICKHLHNPNLYTSDSISHNSYEWRKGGEM